MSSVLTFNGRTGDISLIPSDIASAGGALIISPPLEGIPTAPTALPGTNTTQLATTAYVLAAVASGVAGVGSFNARVGIVTLESSDVTGAGGALLDSPTFTGVPAAPTAAPSTDTTQIATTAFVQAALTDYVIPIATSSVLGGVKQGANVTIAGDGTLSVATPYTLPAATLTTLGGVSIGSGLTVTPQGQVATIASQYTLPQATTTVLGGVTVGSGLGVTAGNIFLNLPNATTSTLGGVIVGSGLSVLDGVVSVVAGEAVTTFNTRTGTVVLEPADITGAGGALIDNPVFTGAPSAPTASLGTNTTQIATTAFVQNAVSEATTGVASFNGRTGMVLLESSDLTGSGGALVNSPAFTGVPTAPTASTGTNTVQLATTAFVNASIAANLYVLPQATTSMLGGVIVGSGLGVSSGTVSANVLSVAGRTGAITLAVGDVTGAAPLASPTLTGIPAAPTAITGTNTTQIATTAFVNASIVANVLPPATTSTLGGVIVGSGLTVQGNGTLSANVTTVAGRTGAVVLAVGDVTGAAPVASPVFTGVPAAPTPTAGTNTTQLATTAFVNTAIAGNFVNPSSSIGLTVVNGSATTYMRSDAAPALSQAIAPTWTAQHIFNVGPIFNGVAGSQRGYYIQTGGVSRWYEGSDTSLETGGNSGTNWILNTYGDNGSVGVTALSVNRASAQATFAVRPLFGANTPYDTGNLNISLYAPLASPTFTGVPAGPTASTGTNTTQLATTQFVNASITAGGYVLPAATTSTLGGVIVGSGLSVTSGTVSASVLSVNGGTGAITGLATLASPTFTGTPAAPTAAPGTSTTQLATTAFVATSYAPLASPALTGTPTAPTATALTSTTQLATTAFVTSAGTAITSAVAATYAPLASPALTGAPTAPTATAGTASTQIATTAFVTNTPTINNANLTGVPTAPTATAGTNTTQVATTAFVGSAVSTAVAGYLPLTGGTLTGQLQMSGAAQSNTRQIKYETAGVLRWTEGLTVSAESGSNAGADWNLSAYSDTGAFLNTPIQVTRATGVATFSVIPVGPTPTAGDNSTNQATTAFVQNAVYSHTARTVTSSTGTVGLTDYYIGVNFAGASTINIPGSSGFSQGQIYVIKDESGKASINNITITTGGPTIDGQASVVLGINYGSITLLWNTSFWSII